MAAVVAAVAALARHRQRCHDTERRRQPRGRAILTCRPGPGRRASRTLDRSALARFAAGAKRLRNSPTKTPDSQATPDSCRFPIERVGVYPKPRFRRGTTGSFSNDCARFRVWRRLVSAPSRPEGGALPAEPVGRAGTPIDLDLTTEIAARLSGLLRHHGGRARTRPRLHLRRQPVEP